MPPVTCSWNDIQETSAEIPHWWRVTTQIWVMLLTRVVNLLQPIRSNTKIWVVTCHQYGISVLVFRCQFVGKSVVALQNFGYFPGLSEPTFATYSCTAHSTANGTTLRQMSFNPSTLPVRPSLQLLSSTELVSKEL